MIYTDIGFVSVRLSPVIELFFAPWSDKDILETISTRKNRQVLFESGEGLNVYEELVANNYVFYEVFSVWSKQNLPTKPIKLNIQIGSCLDILSKFVQHSSLQCGPFSDLRTPQGQLMLTRSFHFLRLIESFPDILLERSKLEGEKLAEMITDLKRHLYD
jgi:hypothetical protein